MERRTSRVSVEPEQQLLVGIGGEGGVEVERIGQVEVALDMHGPGGADPARPDVEAAGLGGRPRRSPWVRSGSNRALATLDQPLQLGGADLVRPPARRGLVYERRRRRSGRTWCARR